MQHGAKPAQQRRFTMTVLKRTAALIAPAVQPLAIQPVLADMVFTRWGDTTQDAQTGAWPERSGAAMC
ncbi:hypothetical protein CG50_00970 [Paenirhodobacter enshiensis]|uniref:Uncharacterized protein n=2 Tax=Paenirhodobacter enshiensis TaxID=1105367 RepID=A0A086XXW5_9RHOB|nr:hypothetical protein CG50_00970 [Paenirhodobacter enshiensis]